jgi:hypothetical protein
MLNGAADIYPEVFVHAWNHGWVPGAIHEFIDRVVQFQNGWCSGEIVCAREYGPADLVQVE